LSATVCNNPSNTIYFVKN